MTSNPQIKGVRGPYIFFSMEQREIIKKKNPLWSNVEISKEIGIRWKNLKKEDVKKYREMCMRDMKRFENELNAFNTAINDANRGQNGDKNDSDEE